ncbi:hypothetical protein OnM2_015001 [Erysiphe neolycopersici]|uniref:Uncharacterized protein n=1 Tax=Erysiphe neolycopersici TaxID=212602 RepID=A0A420I585_9PEZI|nr:hypothetical protein OnM2_015001 [Erysiphe neolycopersici]
MYSYLQSQQSQLCTAPTSSTKQIQSFDLLHHQTKDGSSVNFKLFLKPSSLSSNYRESNPTDSEHANGSFPTKDQISIIHGFEWVRLPDLNIFNVLRIDNVKFVENQLIHNSEHGKTKMTQKLSVCTLRSTIEPLEPGSLEKQSQDSEMTSTNREKSGFYLLNPIFLLARLRTPQHTFQLLTEKNLSNLIDANGQNEEFESKSRDMLAYGPNIFDQVQINSIFPNVESCYESSSSTCSPDSLFTDKSPETSISEYTSDPVFSKDTGMDLTLQIDDSSAEGILKKIVDPIQNWEHASINKETSKFEDGTKSIFGPEYIYPIEILKKSQDISENTQLKNNTHLYSVPCSNELSIYQQLFLTPTTYHLMPHSPNTNCPLTTLVDNSNINESNFNNNNNNNKSLTKYLSPYKLITHYENRSDQLWNNLISEKHIEPNFLRFNSKYPTLRNLNHKDSNIENIQNINDLTEDSLAAHQHALESAACYANSNVDFFLKNIVSEDYLQLKQEQSQPSLSNDSYEASSQEAVSLSDEFEDDFYLDDDSQDCAFIEAVNAEALANDFDGFYEQEFGLYSSPDVIGRKVSNKNGGNSRTRYTHSSRNSRFWSREPLLSPISESSEFSFCSPYEAPVFYSSNLIGEITTSGLEQSPSGRQKTSYENINNLDSFLKSRQDLWSESQNSVQDFSNCSQWSSDTEE